MESLKTQRAIKSENIPLLRLLHYRMLIQQNAVVQLVSYPSSNNKIIKNVLELRHRGPSYFLHSKYLLQKALKKSGAKLIK